MAESSIKYFFSKRVLIAPIGVFLIPLLIFLFVFYWEPPIIYSIILIPFAVFIFIGLALDNLILTYYFITKRPAIIISEDTLIDNINRQTYNWVDIFDIYYHEYGKKIRINIGDGYKSIYLNRKSWIRRKFLKIHLDITHGSFWLNPSTINCNQKELMDNLLQFYKAAKDKKMNSQQKSVQL